MDEAPLPEAQAGLVRYLKTLVTALTVTMIVGLIALISVVVMRINADTPALPAFDGASLPEGAEAVTFWNGRAIVITDQGRIIVLDQDLDTVLQEFQLD